MLTVKFQNLTYVLYFLFIIYCSPSKAQLTLSKSIVYNEFKIDSSTSISMPDYLIKTSSSDDTATIAFENIFSEAYCTIEKQRTANESLADFYLRTAKNLKSQNCTILKIQNGVSLSLKEIRIWAKKILSRRNLLSTCFYRHSHSESQSYSYRISLLHVNTFFVIICFWTKEVNSDYLNHFEFAQSTISTK